MNKKSNAYTYFVCLIGAFGGLLFGYDHEARLKNLEKYPDLIARRDDLLLEEITSRWITSPYPYPTYKYGTET